MTELKNIMFCATAFAPSLLGAKELPNIIYIVTDQQTASAMSCMGNTDVHTPNMDRLAQAGILFKNAYCSAPLSGPSRHPCLQDILPTKSDSPETTFLWPILCVLPV